MDFLHWGFLAGGAAIAAPIIIHLLNRQRYKRVEWAAMRFIVEAVKRTHRRLKLEEILLLALRCALILLMALLMARPYVTTSLFGMKLEGNQHAIVAIDASYSMNTQVGNQKFFDRAKEVATHVAGTLKRGDKLSVVLMSQRPTTLHSDPTQKFDDAAAEIMNLKASDFGGSLDDSLDLIRNLAIKAKPLKSHLYLITDNQARFWEALQTFESKKAFQDITGPSVLGVKTVLIDVGATVAGNLTVTGFRTDAPLLVPHTPFHFQADVANYSPASVSNVEISLVIDGERLQTQTVSVESGKSTTVTFPHAFTTAGPHAATVQLEVDPLSTDNARHLGLNVEDSVKVLIVDPNPSAKDSESETFFLRMALNPAFSESRQDLAPFRPILASAADLPGMNLREYAFIVLCNLDSLPLPTVQSITDYVRQGGGVWVFLGSKVDPRVYNDVMYRNGEGFLPGPLLAKAGDPTRAKFVRVDLETSDHPIARKFKQEEWPFEMYAYQYITCGQLPSDAQVIARYALDGQSPAVVERAIGKGRCVMITTSCGDLNWSELFASPTMIMLAQEYGLLLSAGISTLSTLQVGDKVSQPLPSGFSRRDLLIQPPSGEPVPHTAAQDDNGVLRVTLDDLARAGIYRVLDRDNVVTYVAANVDPAEGNLDRVPAPELDALRTAYNFTLTTYDKGIEAFSKEGGGKEMWGYVLALLALLMVVEMFFAMKFGAHKK